MRGEELADDVYVQGAFIPTIRRPLILSITSSAVENGDGDHDCTILP